jgi:lipopolysaccharide export LptBFGC system permease protein LptF
MKILLLFLLAFSFLSIGYGQSDYKQVYDKSLENQIKSSVGMNGEWQFSPEWYYNFLHNKYKDKDNIDNNKVPLDSMISNAEKSLLEVMAAHQSINVVYENEIKHWSDRTSDRELNQVMDDIENAKKAIKSLTAEFSNYDVPVNEAQKVYDEYERVNEKYLLLNDMSLAHMDNQKRRRAYELCLDEFVRLINVCYRIHYYCLVASKNEKLDEYIETYNLNP